MFTYELIYMFFVSKESDCVKQDLTTGRIGGVLLRFSLPLMLGNLLQQLYNVADTLIVGQILGADALAAVGSAYTLMTFLTSILLGLCMGSGVVFSIQYGEKNDERLKSSLFASFVFIGACTLILNIAVFVWIDPILHLLQVPDEVYSLMRRYLLIIFIGIAATFLYNYFASLMRAVGNAVVPLIFLGAAALLNIGLDLLFVIVFRWGVEGAAAATVAAQFASGLGLAAYFRIRFPEWRIPRRCMRMRRGVLAEISRYSLLTCMQQSIMNFGILMVQGLINSFGPTVMAAFAAAVKIDSFAYMPVQDFGNAFSTFAAQNVGAKKPERIQSGIKLAVRMVLVFCLGISSVVMLFAKPLMLLFVQPQETEVLAVGVEYLRIVGAFYWGIGCLFLLYGYYRAVKKPGMSVILTITSLGTRVALAYTLSAIPAIGVVGIWWSVPIGWLLADLMGYGYYRLHKKDLCDRMPC